MHRRKLKKVGDGVLHALHVAIPVPPFAVATLHYKPYQVDILLFTVVIFLILVSSSL